MWNQNKEERAWCQPLLSYSLLMKAWRAQSASFPYCGYTNEQFQWKPGQCTVTFSEELKQQDAGFSLSVTFWTNRIYQFRHMKDFLFFSHSLPCVLADVFCFFVPFHFDHFKYMKINSQAVVGRKSVSLAYAMNHLAPNFFISFSLNCVFLLLLANLFMPCSLLLCQSCSIFSKAF